ncbi:E3 ubiquitin-protein ligase [Aratus pisonii nudivirus]|nr:E3 ubiquitin-protein ligase [Aratus pisonii nudivirus]
MSDNGILTNSQDELPDIFTERVLTSVDFITSKDYNTYIQRRLPIISKEFDNEKEIKNEIKEVKQLINNCQSKITSITKCRKKMDDDIKNHALDFSMSTSIDFSEKAYNLIEKMFKDKFDQENLQKIQEKLMKEYNMRLEKLHEKLDDCSQKSMKAITEVGVISAYNDTFKNELKCPICHKLMDVPTMATNTCTHVFCRQCLLDSLAKSGTSINRCHVCGHVITNTTFNKVVLTLKNICDGFRNLHDSILCENEDFLMTTPTTTAVASTSNHSISNQQKMADDTAAVASTSSQQKIPHDADSDNCVEFLNNEENDPDFLDFVESSPHESNRRTVKRFRKN